MSISGSIFITDHIDDQFKKCFYRKEKKLLLMSFAVNCALRVVVSKLALGRLSTVVQSEPKSAFKGTELN